MECRSCKWALMRSEIDKHFNYECCEVGVMPMMPELPRDTHQCEMWEVGKEKAPEKLIFLWGEDIEL